MLFGTSLFFRAAYFFTSFSPALFLLSLNFRLEKELCVANDFINHMLVFIIYWGFPILVVGLAVLSAIYIQKYLLKRLEHKKYEVSNKAVNFNMCSKKFKNSRGHVIQAHEGIKINSGFIAFAISVVAPSVVLTLINDGHIASSLLIIVMFFLLLMMSNDVFPNIILPIFGVHLMVTRDNYNIFYLSKQNDFLSGIKKLNSLGNAGGLARTYVLSNDNYSDIEMEDK